MAAEMSASDDLGEPHSQVDTLIDELISDILNSSDAGQPAKSGGQDRPPSPVSLFGTVRSAMAGVGSGTSMLERLLLAEALAGVLADAIAPALADALAPRIMKALASTGAAEHPAPPAARPHPSERRKTSVK